MRWMWDASMIDCHILHPPSPNEVQLNAAIKSAEHPLVKIHLIEWDRNQSSLLEARTRGFNTGSNPYVSFVDSDDLVLGDPWYPLLNGLTPERRAAYTNSIIWDEKYNTRQKMFSHLQWSWHLHTHPYVLPIIHQLILCDRIIMTEALSKVTVSTGRVEQYIYSEIAKVTNWNFLPEVIGYEWRRSFNGNHIMTSQANTDYIL
jgi:hypothetical protein